MTRKERLDDVIDRLMAGVVRALSWFLPQLLVAGQASPTSMSIVPVLPVIQNA